MPPWILIRPPATEIERQRSADVFDARTSGRRPAQRISHGRALTEEEKENHAELLRQQMTLARFGELALKSDDLDEILTEACRLVGEAVGTDLAKVVELLREDGETLLVRAGVGWKPGVVGEATVKLRTLSPRVMPSRPENRWSPST